MSVAHDLNALEEQKRKEDARKLVGDSFHRLHELRRRTGLLEAGDFVAWQDAGLLADDLIRAAAPLELGLLVACAREVQYFTTRRAAGAPHETNLVLYLLSALDTLGMELERLRHDRELR